MYQCVSHLRGNAPDSAAFTPSRRGCCRSERNSKSLSDFQIMTRGLTRGPYLYNAIEKRSEGGTRLWRTEEGNSRVCFSTPRQNIAAIALPRPTDTHSTAAQSQSVGRRSKAPQSRGNKTPGAMPDRGPLTLIWRRKS